MPKDGVESPIASALKSLWRSSVGTTGKKALRLLDRWLREASARLPRRGPFSDADAEDIRSRVLLEIVKRSRDPAWADSVVNPEAYLFTCLHNASISEWRRIQADARRAQGLRIEETVNAEVAFVGSIVERGSESENEFDAALARERLASILSVCIEESLCAARNDAEREERRRAIDQVLGLHARAISMEQVLAEEGITPESSKEERTRLRNRLQKRHERARKALSDAIESLRTRGRLPPDRAARILFAVQLLRRCQRATDTRVNSRGATE